MKAWMGLAWALVVGALPDVVALAGVAVTAYGAAQIYEPAGYLVGGAFLVVLGIIGVVRRG